MPSKNTKKKKPAAVSKKGAEGKNPDAASIKAGVKNPVAEKSVPNGKISEKAAGKPSSAAFASAADGKTEPAAINCARKNKRVKKVKSEAERKRFVKRLIALITAIAVFLGGLGTGLYFILKGGNAKELDAPQNLRVKDFNQSTDFLFRVEWDKVEGAWGYSLEYVYSLYPDEVHKTNAVGDNYYMLERKRGDFGFTITAHGADGKTKKSERFSFTIGALKLDKIPTVSAAQEADNSLRISWEKTQYAYLNDIKQVSLYEWTEEFYYYSDEDGYIPEEQIRTPGITRNNFRVIDAVSMAKFKSDGYAMVKIKVRPLNYSRELGSNLITYGPPELYDIYDSGDWTVKEYIL